jgi:hypothetical protein
MNKTPVRIQEETMSEAQILYDRHVCFHVSELRLETVDEDGSQDLIGVCTISGRTINAGQCTGLPCSKVLEVVE